MLSAHQIFSFYSPLLKREGIQGWVWAHEKSINWKLHEIIKLAHCEFPEHYHYSKQELGNTSEFVSQYCSLTGPSYAISTACSSSGRVFLAAQRLLDSGIADAVLVGGVDTLCKLTLNGFHGLEALSTTHCQPFSASRNGINIGEAAAFMLLSKTKVNVADTNQNIPSIALLGCGDSSDAHHISAPHPEGNGAVCRHCKASGRR